MKRMFKMLLSLMLLCVLSLQLLPAAAEAKVAVDLDATCSLTLRYPAIGAEFSLYRVGDMDITSELALSGDFAADPVSLERSSAEEWGAAATTLAGYAARDKREPLRTGTVGAEGTLCFEGLGVGLYLVTSESYTYERVTYTAQPLLIALPSLTADDSWDYDPIAVPKFDSVNEPEPYDLRVHKVWADKTAPSHRPKSVEVQLLRDGEVFDTVQLSAQNQWSHTWEKLEGRHTYQLVETTVPKDYTVAVTVEEHTFIVTNTLKPNVPPDKPTPPTPKLPQTGMLLWPIPVLACLGLGCLVIAVGLKRGREDHGA